MVLDDDQHMILLAHGQQLNPQQRPSYQVERRPHLGIDPGRQRRIVQLAWVLDHDGQRQVRMNMLPQLARGVIEGGAQWLVPGDDLVECRLQRRQLERPRTQRRRNVVGGALWSSRQRNHCRSWA